MSWGFSASSKPKRTSNGGSFGLSASGSKPSASSGSSFGFSASKPSAPSGSFTALRFENKDESTKMKKLQTELETVKKVSKEYQDRVKKLEIEKTESDRVNGELSRTVLKLQAQTNSLRQQMNAMRQQEENKKADHEEVSQSAMGKVMKTDVAHIQQELSQFSIMYNHEKIMNLYRASSDQLMVNDEIDSLDQELRSFGKYLMDTKSKINSLLYPDVSKYEQWNVDQIIQWISMLENGRFRQYLPALRKGMSDEDYDGDCLQDITAGTLQQWAPNMKSAKERRTLLNHFKALQNQMPQIAIQNNPVEEGTATAFL